MLFEMLAGERPFSADSADELAEKIESGTARLLASISPSIPRRLARVVERAMACDPQLRFGSIADLIDALEPFHPNGPYTYATKPAVSARTATLPPHTTMPSSSALARPRSLPPPPPLTGRTVVSAGTPPPAAPMPDITTTSASWELTEPVGVRGFQYLLFGRLPWQRAAVWCLVLLGALISARALQRMLAPALRGEEPATGSMPRQSASPLPSASEPPLCYGDLGATDPRCAQLRLVPPPPPPSLPPSAAPVRPTFEWPRDAGMRAPEASPRGSVQAPAAAPSSGAQRRTGSHGPRARDAASTRVQARPAAVRGEPSNHKRNVTTPRPSRPRAGDPSPKTHDPFERLDHMNLQ
jgi:hypothetical protein